MFVHHSDGQRAKGEANQRDLIFQHLKATVVLLTTIVGVRVWVMEHGDARRNMMQGSRFGIGGYANCQLPHHEDGFRNCQCLAVAVLGQMWQWVFTSGSLGIAVCAWRCCGVWGAHIIEGTGLLRS